MASIESHNVSTTKLHHERVAPPLPVQRTFYAHRPLAHYMSVNHGSREIGVTQQFLHGANVGAGLEQMRGKAVAKV